MSVVLPRKAIDEVSRSPNFKQAMLEKVGDLSGIDVMFNGVLVAIYVRPGITAGGIIRPDSNVEEDVWQGKVGLVLKVGPDAFKDDGEISFNGQRVRPGEWVGFNIGDTKAYQIRDWPCRLLKDISIRMKVADPTIIL